MIKNLIIAIKKHQVEEHNTAIDHLLATIDAVLDVLNSIF